MEKIKLYHDDRRKYDKVMKTLVDNKVDHGNTYKEYYDLVKFPSSRLSDVIRALIS